MSGPKIQRQPWIDYLVDAIAKEQDANVSKYAPTIFEIVKSVKEDPSKKSSSVFVLRSLKTFIVDGAINKSRAENLLDGLIEFTEKLTK